MLIIYGALKLGGIETFYMRMAKARFMMGKKTKILLTLKKDSSDVFLLKEVRKYAEVYFLDDFIKSCFFKALPLHFLLLKPIDIKKISSVFYGVKQVHVSSSIYGFFYLSVCEKLKIHPCLTVGVYHSKEFTWGLGGRLPYYERLNRFLFSKLLESDSVYFFNEKLAAFYSDSFRLDIKQSNVFPLGVIDDQGEVVSLKPLGRSIKIVSVGRLVSFKAYNLWMIDIIKKLKEQFDVEYHIYGSGPLENAMKLKIKKHELEGNVVLKGDLDYSDFRSTVSQYDIFVGSGTAIVEACSLGVSSIVGIESVKTPLSYGFLCDIEGFSYNEDNLYEKYNVEDLILNYLGLTDEEVRNFKCKHIKWAKRFSMVKCVNNFEQGVTQVANQPIFPLLETNLIFKFKYSLSFVLFSLKCKLRNGGLSNVVYG